MDKTWIHNPITVDPVYRRGCKSFLEFAFANNNEAPKIYCPCKRCLNICFQERDVVEEHIIINGFDQSYTKWTYHGEIEVLNNGMSDDVVDSMEDFRRDDMDGLIYDGLGIPRQGNKGPNEETKNFFKLLKDADRELYPGCLKYSLLSFLVRILHTKALFGWSDKSLDALLEILNDAFPQCQLPASNYEAKKFRDALSFDYKKYDACPNDCMLFWKENAHKDKCDFCEAPRYKKFEGDTDDENGKEKKVAVKQLRHFPLKPRLQRLFMCKETASLMRWHDAERKKDGLMRHPADSPAWKSFDEKYHDFALDPRNIRLSLASDGFNPYRTMSITHSTWPVLLVALNGPPESGHSQSDVILSLLIDGPNAPGNDIDVYLEPLIDELNEFWAEGVDTYDVVSDEMFRLRAALMWTINDFPAYANLSGWSTKGRLACPVCNKDTDSRWLKHGHKFCYMGSRRALDDGHRFRNDKSSFDGTVETRKMPTRLSGEAVLRQVEHIKNEFGKRDRQSKGAGKKRKKSESSTSTSIPNYNWKKKSIFFELPYWKDNLLRHNIDVMHTEKNAGESLLYTLLGDEKKSKDGLKARRDLEDFGIRKEMHPVPRAVGKPQCRRADFTLTKEAKNTFLRTLKFVKVPEGYAGNISRCVNLQKGIIYGLKSHDYHILIQQLLPIAVRNLLPKNVAHAIVELGNFFRILCSKVIDENEFTLLEKRIQLTLCQLEKIFPPAFFDIMVHLLVHLPEEAKIAGPVAKRWMYSPERYMCALKKFVRNRSRPEGSIAEGYLAEECTTFCSRYLNEVESKLNRKSQNNVSDEAGIGKGKRDEFILDNTQWEQAHRYVLANTAEVAPFRQQHSIEIESASRKGRKGKREQAQILHKSFSKWFREKVAEMIKLDPSSVSDELKSLAIGPNKWVKRYKEFRINGLRFRTIDRERKLKTQNSGVMVTASTLSFSSGSDDRPIAGDVPYYGILTDIIELSYSDKVKHVMFKCDWVDNEHGMKVDEFKYTMVNFKHLMYKQNLVSDEPFVLASQAQQVWYMKDPVELGWKVVVKSTPLNFYIGETSYGTVDLQQDNTSVLQEAGCEPLLVDDEALGVDENLNVDSHSDDDIEDDFVGEDDVDDEAW